jgi:pyridoxamine 5'-phosphate oxidase family protein
VRAVAVLLALVIVSTLVYGSVLLLQWSTRRRTLAAYRQATWQLRQYGEAGFTIIAVSLARPTGEVLDSHVVERIADSDPQWSIRFNAAILVAEERAFQLNGLGPDALGPG